MPETYHHGDLRQALVAAALKALDRDGAMPSWRALARECGVSHAAPYRHFDSLEALQAAVAAACFRHFVEKSEVELRRHRDPYARVAAAIRAYLQFAAEHPHWYALMFGAALDYRRYPEERQAGVAAFALLADAVRDCSIPDPARVAYVLWAAHHGLADLVRLGLRPPGTPASAQASDLLIDMSIDWLRGMAPGGQADARKGHRGSRRAPARRGARARPSSA